MLNFIYYVQPIIKYASEYKYISLTYAFIKYKNKKSAKNSLLNI